MSPFWQGFVGVSAAFFLILAVPTALKALGEWFNWKAQVTSFKREEARRWGPYTRIVLIECPNLSMVGVDCFKGDEMVLHASADLPPWLHRTRAATRFDV